MRIKRKIPLSLCVLLALVHGNAQTQEAQLQTTFHVRYIAEESVYIDGGRSSGLSEGMLLTVKSAAPAKAQQTAAENNGEGGTQLRVLSVAETSAVCEIVSKGPPIAVGDIAALGQAEVEKLVIKRTLSSTRQYPVVVSFTGGDPMDEELREQLPRPPLPEVNQARGRIGFDFSTIHSGGPAASNSSQAGIVIRADITRINGTYWNLTGYWRGQLQTSSNASTPTIQDLINRTYQFGLLYANPKSRWTFGIGRVYLPWAPSLQTIDGGYAGRKISSIATLGAFAGLAPDPTSYNYNPNLHMGGGLINFAGGDFDNLRYNSTFGVGVATIVWKVDRSFMFSENSVTYKRVFSVYHSMQVDKPSTGPGVTPVGIGLRDSYLSFRYQPNRHISFDMNHSYFRDVPTYDPQLVGTGLLDKLLFQGVSGGVRVELPARISLYTSLGQSSSSTDKASSWNTMYGASMGQIWKTGVHMDVHYAKFNSAYAQGSYRSILLSRNFHDNVRFNFQAGQQAYTSPLTTDNGSRFANFFVDTNLGARYFIEGGFTLQRGALQNYNQIYTTFGYRFDNRRHHVAGGPNVPHN
jgi:hypothetical protein